MRFHPLTFRASSKRSVEKRVGLKKRQKAQRDLPGHDDWHTRAAKYGALRAEEEDRRILEKNGADESVAGRCRYANVTKAAWVEKNKRRELCLIGRHFCKEKEADYLRSISVSKTVRAKTGNVSLSISSLF